MLRVVNIYIYIYICAKGCDPKAGGKLLLAVNEHVRVIVGRTPSRTSTIIIYCVLKVRARFSGTYVWANVFFHFTKNKSVLYLVFCQCCP